MPRITHVELHADTPQDLGSFYSQVFGWIIQKKQTGQEDYWFMFSGGANDQSGINAGLKKGSEPGVQWVPTIHVDALDTALEKVLAHGGRVTHPKRAVTSTGYLAYCEDPQGNLFGLLEKDSSVA